MQLRDDPEFEAGIERLGEHLEPFVPGGRLSRWIRRKADWLRRRAAAAIVVGMLALAASFGPQDGSFDVLLMDSAYPDFVYNERTRESLLSNNRDLEDIIDELGIRNSRKELVSHDWTNSDAIRDRAPT